MTDTQVMAALEPTQEQLRKDAQNIGAAISNQNWQAVERAYNTIRDRIDAWSINLNGTIRTTGIASSPVAEPVAWMYEKGDRTTIWRDRAGPGEMCHGNGWTETPLYATPLPPPAVDAEVSEDQVEVAALAFAKEFYGPGFDPFQNPEAYDMAEKATRAVIVALSGKQSVTWTIWDGAKVPSIDGRDSRKGFIWFAHETEQQAIARGQSEIFYWPWHGEDEKPCVRAYALATPPSVPAQQGEWREIEQNMMLKGLRRSPKYYPAIGETCRVSGPNCDDAAGYTWLEQEVLWRDDLFIVTRTKGCWPTITKLELALFEPATPPSQDQKGVEEPECENCGEVYGEDPYCPVHGDRAK